MSETTAVENCEHCVQGWYWHNGDYHKCYACNAWKSSSSAESRPAAVPVAASRRCPAAYSGGTAARVQLEALSETLHAEQEAWAKMIAKQAARAAASPAREEHDKA